MEWQAVSLIEGWSSGWQQSAEIIAAIRNAATRIEIANSADPKAAANAAKFVSGKETLDSLTNFSSKKNWTKRENLTPAEEARKYFEKRYGS